MHLHKGGNEQQHHCFIIFYLNFIFSFGRNQNLSLISLPFTMFPFSHIQSGSHSNVGSGAFRRAKVEKKALKKSQAYFFINNMPIDHIVTSQVRHSLDTNEGCAG